MLREKARYLSCLPESSFTVSWSGLFYDDSFERVQLVQAQPDLRRVPEEFKTMLRLMLSASRSDRPSIGLIMALIWSWSPSTMVMELNERVHMCKAQVQRASCLMIAN